MSSVSPKSSSMFSATANDRTSTWSSTELSSTFEFGDKVALPKYHLCIRVAALEFLCCSNRSDALSS